MSSLGETRLSIQGTSRNVRVCFVGSGRYHRPLGETEDKKFQALATIAHCDVVAFSHDLRPRRFFQHARFYLLPSPRWPVLRYGVLLVGGFLLGLWSVLHHRVEVLVAQSPYEGVPAAWVKILARLLGRRCALLVESHGDFEESLFLQRSVWASWLYRRIMTCAARFSLRHANALRAISDSTAAQLTRWAPGRLILQLTTWTDLTVFLEAGSLRGSAADPEVLYAGVLIPRKAVHVAVAAFSRVAQAHPGATMRIVGHPENPAYARAVRAEVDRRGLNHRIAIEPAVAQRELAERMARAAVFVLPSVSEGLGRVVLEAMAAGTPVIGSRVGGIPDLVQDGVTGFLVPPGDADALADRMDWIMDHPEDAREMGRRARTAAAERFSAEKYVQGYAALYTAAQTHAERTAELRRDAAP